MKKFLALAAAASLLALAAPASAQTWQSINQRQAQLDQRIDVGVRNGSLTRAEASRLRDDYRDLAYLEARYREDGLSYGERADLDRRFDALSSRIRYERQDNQDRNWQDRNWNDGRWTPISSRQREMEWRIDAGLRDGSLSRREASRLRAQFSAIVQLENRYRRNGFTAAERRVLDGQYGDLSNQIMAERRDWDHRRG